MMGDLLPCCLPAPPGLCWEVGDRGSMEEGMLPPFPPAPMPKCGLPQLSCWPSILALPSHMWLHTHMKTHTPLPPGLCGICRHLLHTCSFLPHLYLPLPVFLVSPCLPACCCSLSISFSSPSLLCSPPSPTLYLCNVYRTLAWFLVGHGQTDRDGRDRDMQD